MDWETFKNRNPELAHFYGSVAACTDKCPAIKNCPATGDWPRGFYSEAVPPIRVLAVLENPGPASSREESIGHEIAHTPGAWPPDRLAGTSFEITGSKMRAVMSDPPRSASELRRGTGGPLKITMLHRGLVYILSQVLEVNPKDVYKSAAHTNAVKCSGKTGLRGTSGGPETLIHCGEKFLRWEINHYRPKLLLAVAGDSKWLLERSGSDVPFAYVPHPQSWRGAVLTTVPDRLREARDALRRTEGRDAARS